jgi:hypothetical protein
MGQELSIYSDGSGETTDCLRQSPSSHHCSIFDVWMTGIAIGLESISTSKPPSGGERAVTNDDYSLAGEPRSTGGRHHRAFPFAQPEKVVPAETVESVKDSTVPLLPATQVQAAFKPRPARHLQL